jgi:hypothetical protein
MECASARWAGTKVKRLNFKVEAGFFPGVGATIPFMPTLTATSPFSDCGWSLTVQTAALASTL